MSSEKEGRALTGDCSLFCLQGISNTLSLADALLESEHRRPTAKVDLYRAASAEDGKRVAVGDVVTQQVVLALQHGHGQ